MGSIFKLESRPEIRGPNPNISSEESNYFFRINSLLRKSYISNLYNNDNLTNSLELKSFKSNPTRPNIVDVTWLEYITNYLEDLIYSNHYSWCSELLIFINEQSFISESKFDSTFFYNEFLIKTIPQSLYDEKDIDNDENIIDIDKIENYNSKQPINMEELDITANLGGSYLDLNTDDLPPDDPTVQYQERRKLVKKYVKIFKEHIYKNFEHPIMVIISGFNRIFCKYINTYLKNQEIQLRKNEITGEQYNNNLSKFETEITTNLQNFITRMHCTVKLFYSMVIDYGPFQEEKDDLMNMLITIFFKTGNLYETIYELYNLAFSKQIQDLQDKLINLRNVKPKNLDVQVKFCLDDDTLELQKKILKEKREEKNKKEEEKAQSQSKEKDKPKNPKLEKLNTKELNNELDLIKEGDEEEKEDDEEEINTNKKENLNNESGYLLEKINLLDESKGDNDNDNVPIFSGFSQIRNTVNSFINKKFMFPKLHNKLRDTIAIKDQYISEAKVVGKLPVPYLSAIKLLTNLKKYKAPFEKIVIIAAISDQITEAATTFWSEMEKYIKKDFLSIEVDEMMAIFLFIVIKTQMPEIIIFSKMITNFTTPSTRSFSISYNFTLLEASLEYISSIRNLKDLVKDDTKQLKDARKSLAGITNQRLSLLG
jgi:hypothetical protein